MSGGLNGGFDAGVAQLAPGLVATEYDVGENVLGVAALSYGVLSALGDGRVVLVGEGRTLTEHDGAASRLLALDPDRAISAGQDGAIFLHAKAGASPLRSGDGEWVNALDYSQSRDLIAVASGDRVELIGPHGRVGWLAGHESTVTGVAFSPDGHSLAASRYDGISVWSVGDAKPATMLEWKGSMIGVSWSPDGRYIAGATQDRELHVWDMLSGKDYRLGGFETKIRGIDWTADSSHLVTSGADVITAWPINGGPGAFPPEEIGFAYGSRVTCVAAGGGLDKIAGGFSNGAVLIGNARTGEAAIAGAPGEEPVEAVAWNAAQTRLCFGDRGGRVVVVEMP